MLNITNYTLYNTNLERRRYASRSFCMGTKTHTFAMNINSIYRAVTVDGIRKYYA